MPKKQFSIDNGSQEEIINLNLNTMRISMIVMNNVAFGVFKIEAYQFNIHGRYKVTVARREQMEKPL